MVLTIPKIMILGIVVLTVKAGIAASPLLFYVVQYDMSYPGYQENSEIVQLGSNLT